MAVHLLIVDALNLIRRIHAVQGSPCVDTCLHALEQLIVHSQPTHAVAVFDDEDRAHGWRHQRLPEYKAGRAPMPETLVAEMPALRAAFEQRGIRCWASPGSEADDLAATLAVKVAQAVVRGAGEQDGKAQGAGAGQQELAHQLPDLGIGERNHATTTPVSREYRRSTRPVPMAMLAAMSSASIMRMVPDR